MTGAIINHLWQSTVFLFAAALAAFALRRNQASVRHAVWLAASLKFLVPFSLLIGLGGAFAWRSTPVPSASVAPAIVETVQTITEPFAEVSAIPGRGNVAHSPTAIPWPTELGSAWICGCLVIIAIRIRGWLKVRTAFRASTPTTLSGVEKSLDVRATPGLLEPGVVGIWRPVLLLPVGLESALSADQLHAVVAHEMHHIRRRDNLTSALHMIVEVLFWFHPLVWWVGARLIDERERACDEHVLASGAEPDAYAESILNVCKRYVELPVACVSGVTGSDLKKRISAILAGPVGLDLSGVRKALLVVAAVAALAVPVAAGMLTAPLRMSTQAPGPLPKFEAVSVRPCDATSTAPTPGAGRSGLAGAASPGRLNFPCRDLLSLMNLAYGLYANGRVNSIAERAVFPRPADVPDWIWRDRFVIEAKAEGEPPALVMLGPMLQRVLEDQFKLKVHRETRQVPVYELVVAKGGSKLTSATPGACVPYDFSVSPQPPLAAGQHRCDNHNERDADGNYVYIAEMSTVDDFFLSWGDRFGRRIVNKTGITGPVAIRFVQQTHTSGPDDEIALLVAAMRNQLGLELRPGKGPIEFFVIDHAERPTPGGPSAPPARAQGAGPTGGR